MEHADDEISVLCGRIIDVFPKHPFPRILAAYGSVDADRVGAILRKNWWDVTEDDLRACGSSEICLFITAEGLLYYLPAFLLLILRQKDFGWFEETLLPTRSDFRDLAEYFSGGTLQGALFDENAKRFWTRVSHLHANLNILQRKCVSRYLEIAETHHFQWKKLGETLEFNQQLKKWITFWNSPEL